MNQPPTARGVVSYAPLARPAGAPDANARFPRVPMARGPAALDVLIVVAGLPAVTFGIAFSGLGSLLAAPWAALGVFWDNVIIGVVTLGLVGGVLWVRRQHPATIGLNRAPIGRVALATLAAVPTCFAAGAVCNVLYSVLRGFDLDGFVRERSEFFGEVPDVPLSLLVPFALFVGVHEEVLFRGFLLGRLRALTGSDVAAIGITSVVFGGLHFFMQGWPGAIQTGAVGLVLAIVVTYTRSLWPAILAHAGIDTIGLLFIQLARPALQEFLQQTTTGPAG